MKGQEFKSVCFSEPLLSGDLKRCLRISIAGGVACMVEFLGMVVFRKLLFAVAGVGFVTLCGCVEIPQAGHRPSPPPLPVALREVFQRPEFASVAVHETEEETNASYRRIRVELVIPPTSDRTNPPVVFDYYRVPAQHSPVILILPISGGREYVVEEFFAHYFARHGLAAVVAHRWKAPRAIELELIDRLLKRSLEENQLALDWIETRPELDTSRLGLFGISMGGIRGVLLTALDPRIKASALGLAGGDLAAILTHSRDRGVTRRRERFLNTTNWTEAEFEMHLRESIALEPNIFAEHIDPANVLLVLGLFDHVVPFKQGWQLREHLGQPETMVLPTGHFTAVLAVPAIQMKSEEFFKTRFGIGPPTNERRLIHSPRGASQWK